MFLAPSTTSVECCGGQEKTLKLGIQWDIFVSRTHAHQVFDAGYRLKERVERVVALDGEYCRCVVIGVQQAEENAPPLATSVLLVWDVKGLHGRNKKLIILF